MQEFMTHMGTVEIHSLTLPTSVDAADSLPDRIPHRKRLTHSTGRKLKITYSLKHNWIHSA